MKEGRKEGDMELQGPRMPFAGNIRIHQFVAPELRRMKECKKERVRE